MKRQQRRSHERGVTSLFIVMFATLMFVTVTVGFMRLMVAEQGRSGDSELSRSAYDSALAGVEDGKRVLAVCQASNYDASNPACIAIKKDDCTTISDAGLVNESNGEVYLKTTDSTSGTDYQQAYTCVKILPNTSEYIGTIEQADGSILVPLRAVRLFSKIQIFWRPVGTSTMAGLASGTSVLLPTLTNWNSTKPLVRAQLIQYANGSLDQQSFDRDGNGHTLYLYPARTGSSSLVFGSDGRRNGTLDPKPVICTTLGTNNGYNCSVEIGLPDPIGGDATNRNAYLRLSTAYRGAEFMVRLLDSGGNIVDFDWACS